jgi:PAS domain-containing protein
MDFEVFESFFEGVLVLDQKLRVVYANPSAKEILGDKLKIGEGCRGLFSICGSCPSRFVKEEGEGVQVYAVETASGKHVCWSMSFVKNGYLWKPSGMLAM